MGWAPGFSCLLDWELWVSMLPQWTPSHAKPLFLVGRSIRKDLSNYSYDRDARSSCAPGGWNHEMKAALDGAAILAPPFSKDQSVPLSRPRHLVIQAKWISPSPRPAVNLLWHRFFSAVSRRVHPPSLKAFAHLSRQTLDVVLSRTAMASKSVFRLPTQSARWWRDVFWCQDVSSTRSSPQ